MKKDVENTIEYISNWGGEEGGGRREERIPEQLIEVRGAASNSAAMVAVRCIPRCS